MVVGGEGWGGLNYYNHNWRLVSLIQMLLCVGCVGVLGGRVVGLEGGHHDSVGFVFVVVILRGVWEWRLVSWLGMQ